MVCAIDSAAGEPEPCGCFGKRSMFEVQKFDVRSSKVRGLKFDARCSKFGFSILIIEIYNPRKIRIYTSNGIIWIIFYSLSN